ncbi:hypothetical protein ON010_g2543 [Phytophthora cinnamomi]|nr:hypothetical protein ON010_g2543 [Phytophthora cinnamomi]
MPHEESTAIAEGTIGVFRYTIAASAVFIPCNEPVNGRYPEYVVIGASSAGHVEHLHHRAQYGGQGAAAHELRGPGRGAVAAAGAQGRAQLRAALPGGGDWQHDFQSAECWGFGNGRERPTHESTQAAERRGALEPVRGYCAAEASTTEDSQKKKKRERKATKDLKLLSFGDEEEAFQDEVDGGATKSKKKKAKKIMSSHDLLDDRKLKSEVDAEVLQRVADTSDEAASEEKKERSRASLKAAVAAASAVSKHLQGNEKLSGEKVEGSAKRSDSTIVGRLDTESQEKKKDREEYVKLREELRKAKKAVPLLMGEEAKKQEKDRAFQDMLTPLQQQRQKYLQRKKTSNRSAREQDTLSKLKKFQAALIDVNVNQREPSKAKESNGSQQEDAEAESYHGQILEDGDDDGDDTNDDKSWMTAKLKFKKHIDDQFRAGNELSADTSDHGASQEKLENVIVETDLGTAVATAVIAATIAETVVTMTADDNYTALDATGIS